MSGTFSKRRWKVQALESFRLEHDPTETSLPREEEPESPQEVGFSVFSTGLAEASCHLTQVISALCFPLPPWHVPAVSLLYPINLVTRESIVGQMPGRQGYFLKLSPHLYPLLLPSVISPAHVIHSRSMTREGSGSGSSRTLFKWRWYPQIWQGEHPRPSRGVGREMWDFQEL